MLNANFNGFFVVIISISVIFLATNNNKRKRKNALQSYNNSLMQFSCSECNAKYSMKSQLSRIDDDKLVSHCWHLFCPRNFKVDSTNSTQWKKSWRIHSKHQAFFTNFYVFFLFADSFFLFNFIITLVCCGAQKLMRPEWAWIDALHGLTTLLTNRTTTITITANSRRAYNANGESGRMSEWEWKSQSTDATKWETIHF